MSSGHATDPAAIRARLTHPVVDSDGHWLEFGPAIGEYLERVAGRGVVDAFNSRNGRIVRDLELTVDQRRDARRPQQGWWTFPTRNTLDRATAMVPRLLYERLDELGLDFSVLYPTTGLAVPFISNDEVRRAACRAFNTFAAEQFAPYADRLTPAAVVPMNTPAEAIEELEHVAKTLKLKVVVMASVIKRPIPAAARRSPELARYATWFDLFGLDSAYDYDPVWAKCIELGIAPTFHTSGRGYAMRVSVSNFTYNHIGHFAVSAEAVCKALFLGGVTRRFPTLKMAFLEGGVGWACNLYADLIGHWKKRNARALAEVDPANLDRKRLAELFSRYADPRWAEQLRSWTPEGEGGMPAMPGAGRLRRLRGVRNRTRGGYPRLVLQKSLFRLRGGRSDERVGLQRARQSLWREGQDALRLRHRPLRRGRHARGIARGARTRRRGTDHGAGLPRFRIYQPGRILGRDESGFLQGHARRKSSGGCLGRVGESTGGAARHKVARADIMSWRALVLGGACQMTADRG